MFRTAYHRLPIRQRSLRFNNANIGSITSSLPTRNYANTAMPADVKEKVDGLIAKNDVMVFSKSYCPYCKATKDLLSKVVPKDKKYEVIELDHEDSGSEIQQYLKSLNGQGTVPHVYINKEFIGGNSDLQALKGAKLEAKLKA